MPLVHSKVNKHRNASGSQQSKQKHKKDNEQTYKNSGVMVSVLASSAVVRGFEPRLGQTKDYKVGIYCFSAKHAALRRKRKDRLARNQDNVSEWGNMSTRGLLCQ